MGFNDINIQVSGPQQPASTYKTKVLKGQVPFAVQVTEPNTKYVIKHNFVLNGDVTIPENCILEFDGGSISGNGHTFTGASFTKLIAPNKRIFYNISIPTSIFSVKEAFVDWFYDNDLGIAASQCAALLPYFCGTIKCSSIKYNLTTPIKMISGMHLDLNRCIINLNADVPAITDLNYGSNTNYGVSYIIVENGFIDVNVKQTTYCTIDVANCSNSEFRNLVISRKFSKESDEETKFVGIRQRRTSGYTGTMSCNSYNNIICPVIDIESGNEGFISDCKIWSDNSYAGIILNSPNWTIEGNQIVGGIKGAIYIPKNVQVNDTRIVNNYFDGSYYNINTHDGIFVDTDAQLWRSIISGNHFWHQKGKGISGILRHCTITSNVFDECDYYNQGLPDIDIDCLYNACVISNNVFTRHYYLTPSSGTLIERPNADSVSFTRPAPIVIQHAGYSYLKTIISSNFVVDSYYNASVFDTNVIRSLGNTELLPNNNDYGNYDNRPNNSGIGQSYFNTSTHKPIFHLGNGVWVDGNGDVATVKHSGIFSEKPNATDINIGFQYFCTDKQTTEGATDGIMIFHKGSNVWVDALGRVVS